MARQEISLAVNLLTVGGLILLALYCFDPRPALIVSGILALNAAGIMRNDERSKKQEITSIDQATN